MTAWYCSKTERTPRGALRLWPLHKEQCGKDGQHHHDREFLPPPTQARSTQHASFFQPEREMYSTAVTLLRYIQKQWCRCRNQQMGWKSSWYITLEHWLRWLALFVFFLQIETHKLQTCVKWSSYYTFYNIQIYRGAPVDINDDSNRKTTEDTLTLFFKNISVTL